MNEIMAQNVDDMNQGKPELPNRERPEIMPLMQKLVDHCFKLYDDWKGSSYRAAKIKEAERSRKVYEQLPTVKDWPWKDASNIVLPLTTITIDNLEPRLVAGIIGKDPICQFEMTGQENKDDGTKLIEDWFNKELKNSIGIEDVSMSIVHTLMLDGTVYPVPQYDLVEKTVRDFVTDPRTGQMAINPPVVADPATGQPMQNPQAGKPITQEQTITEYEGGKIDLVPISDMYHADDAGTIKEWEKADKIRKVRFTYGELMTHFQKQTKGYMNIGPWLIGEKKTLTIDEDDKTPGQVIAGVDVGGKESIECIECHITYPIFRVEEDEDTEQTDFREERVVVTIAVDSKIPIRVIKNLDLNMKNDSMIKRIRLFPESGRSLGTCVYGKLKGVQDGSSDIFNMIVNCAYISMMPWYFYDDRAGIKGQQEIYPGAGVNCDSVEGVKLVTFNSQPEAHLAVLNFLVTLWQRLESIGDYQIGAGSSDKRTATEVMAVIQEGNIKHNYQAKTTKGEFVSVLKTLYDLYYKNMPMDKQFIYAGKPVQIPRNVMRRDFKFTLNASTEMANKLIERKTAEDLYGLAGKNPLINPMKTTEDLLKAYDRENPKEYINPQVAQLVQAFFQNPEILQVVGKYMQTKQQTAQAIQGGQGGQPSGPAIQ